VFDADLPLLCQVGTETWHRAEAAGIRTVAQAFVDRAYTDEGLLQTRSLPDALVTDPEKAAARAVDMVAKGHIESVSGSTVPIQAQALLVHCDTPGAVDIARATREALLAADVDLVPLR
jgi:UPF0271 protein